MNYECFLAFSYIFSNNHNIMFPGPSLNHWTDDNKSSLNHWTDDNKSYSVISPSEIYFCIYRATNLPQ